MPAWLVPASVHHLDTFAESGPEGRVFIGAAWSDSRFGANFATIWKRGEAAAGAPVGPHFHDLRHANSHFAAPASGGEHASELIGRMGHASMQAALIYQHRTADRDLVEPTRMRLLV